MIILFFMMVHSTLNVFSLSNVDKIVVQG